MTWRCELCGDEFTLESLFCESGMPHVVAPKKYYLPGQQQRYGLASNRTPLEVWDRTIITNIPPPDMSRWAGPGSDDEDLGGSVEFINGRFETCNPEQQFWLDQRGGFCTEEVWQAAWMSPKEAREAKLSEREVELSRREAHISHLEQELEQLKNRGSRKGA